MKLRDALGILLLTAFGVGLLSCYGGACLMMSITLESYADMFDEFADDFYEWGAYDSAQEARNEAREVRDQAREAHDYGVYSLVGALLVGVGGACWMVWRWGKNVSSKSTKMHEKALK